MYLFQCDWIVKLVKIKKKIFVKYLLCMWIHTNAVKRILSLNQTLWLENEICKNKENVFELEIIKKQLQ